MASLSNYADQDVINWVKSNHGGIIDKLLIGRGSNCRGIIASDNISEFERIARLDATCILDASVARRELKFIADVHPHLFESDSDADEMLALLLMHLKVTDSIWTCYISSLPEIIDTPMFWDTKDLELMAPSTIYHICKKLRSRIEQDWIEVIQPIVNQFPELFHNTTLETYKWALGIVWSRALDIEVPFSADVNQLQSKRVLIPVVDMFNHSGLITSSLADAIQIKINSGSMMIEVFSPISVNAREECCLSYGPLNNTKLLHTYGFVDPSNVIKHVDYWVSIPEDVKANNAKMNRIREEEALYSYDFKGTLSTRGDGWVSQKLLGLLRIIEATIEEEDQLAHAFEGSISGRNEMAAMSCLKNSLVILLGQMHQRREIVSRSTSIKLDTILCLLDDDADVIEAVIAKLEREIALT